MRTELVLSEWRDDFLEKVNAITAQMQQEGLEVDIQYSLSAPGALLQFFSAMVVGRREV